MTAGNHIAEQCELSKEKYGMNISHHDYLSG